MDRPIILYSNYCPHSKNFLQLLLKHQELFDLFIRMNIDVDPSTKKRPQEFYKLEKMIGLSARNWPLPDDRSSRKIVDHVRLFIWSEFMPSSYWLDAADFYAGYCSLNLPDFLFRSF